MHSYLRAIGFSKLEQKDLDQILQEVIVSCDEKKIAEQGKNEIFAELSRYFGMNIGLRVCFRGFSVWGKVLEFSVSYREDLYYNRLEKISRRT